MPEEDSNITEELVRKVLELYKIGVRQQRIVGILNIEFKTLERIRNRLIAEGQLTKEEIEEAVQKWEKQNEDITYRLLLQGYNSKEIAAEIPYSDNRYITDTVIKRLKEDRKNNRGANRTSKGRKKKKRERR